MKTPSITPTRRAVLTRIGLPVAVSASGLLAGCAHDGWKEYGGNPVIGGKLGVCFDATVLREASGYIMYFSWRTQHAIARTISSDGIHWSTPTLAVKPDQLTGMTEVNRPTVLRRPDGYHMWFTGQDSTSSAIFHARSADGAVWTVADRRPVLAPIAAWEKTAVMCPSVLDDGGQLKMWYSGGDQYEPNAIGYAESADGSIWRRAPAPVLTPEPSHSWEQARVAAADVHRVDGWFYMFYVGFHDIDTAAIGICRSRDGVTDWRRLPTNPIISAPGRLDHFSWEREAVYKPAALFDKDGWKLWYNARRKGVEQIGLATHRALDLGFF